MPPQHPNKANPQRRCVATWRSINVTSRPMIQNKKQKDIQWKAVSCANCSFIFVETSLVPIPKNPKMQSCSVEMPIAVLVSSAPPLLLPQRHAKSRLCRTHPRWRLLAVLSPRRKTPRHRDKNTAGPCNFHTIPWWKLRDIRKAFQLH